MVMMIVDALSKINQFGVKFSRSSSSENSAEMIT